ncbi:SGNH/GDSL hydrolase family protein, partial [Dietzia sp. DQ12-76]|nr:SGNH/GDSL hydrolase family protein [Dietzia sp. DQ12-76]
SACAPADQRWTDFLGGAPTNAAAFHPTALGQQAMSDAIAAAI